MATFNLFFAQNVATSPPFFQKKSFVPCHHEKNVVTTLRNLAKKKKTLVPAGRQNIVGLKKFSMSISDL
jgi:hypothetical protein